MENIVLTPITFEPVYSQEAEIVERKGIGHPDTICDNLAEELSRSLCRVYMDSFGRIMHHNVDKALLVGGRARAEFGGGEVIEPIEIYLVGRATLEDSIDIQELVNKTASGWIERNLKNLDFEKHVKVYAKIKPGSKDLVDLYKRSQGQVPLANDTSFGVGFAPLDPLERAVLEAERVLNSASFKEEHPEVGEDIKVMGVRISNNIRLTIALAFVSKYLKDINEYYEKKSTIKQKLNAYLSDLLGNSVEINLNTADSKHGEVYITVTGTSAEQGDDGQVGRGNRVNGLITPYRPMSLEAAAGKNPVSHIGKIYNTVANQIAKRVIKEIEEVEECYCYIVSQIGKPINEPQVLDIKVRSKHDLAKIKEPARKIAMEELEQMPSVWQGFLKGEFSIA
ncbi:MAG: methionine adenosyltransferase [Aquificaceae bacterium]